MDWLTRDLDEAILKFIANAGPQDTLLCCFYEFHYPRVLDALAAAGKKIRELKIIIDAKENGYTDKNGKPHPSFPREKNLEAITHAKIPEISILRREKNPSDIQHNKFMVLLKGQNRVPTEVWTGSTNISLGGFTGQTNVGHWVRDPKIAEFFKNYWDLLANDPGSEQGESRSVVTKEKKDYRTAVEKLVNVPIKLADIPQGTTALFSPRSGQDVLDLYVDLVDNADTISCITLAFGVNELFKEQLKNNTPQSHITFLLLEKRDEPRENAKTTFIALNSTNNVYEAWGSYIKDPVYHWARETSARALGLNTHVSYIHSKFLLRDPLGLDPIVVTGSANFSPDSTNGNDENMIIVRGNQRVADIYFTEFNRLFNHYYFRSVMETAPQQPGDPALFLCEKPEDWLPNYEPGKLRAKRLKVYADMQGFAPQPPRAGPFQRQ